LWGQGPGAIWVCVPDPDDRPLWLAVLRFSFDFLQIPFISNLPACQLASCSAYRIVQLGRNGRNLSPGFLG
jgi:hypothetical protein